MGYSNEGIKVNVFGFPLVWKMCVISDFTHVFLTI